MTFAEALDKCDQDAGFRATVYAMNTLLMQKGVYTIEEFETYFIQRVEAMGKE